MMPVSYKRENDLDKLLGEFASFDHLEDAASPNQKETAVRNEEDDD